MTDLKTYERKQNIKKNFNKIMYKFFDIIFFPTRFAYKYYEPSNFRKRIKSRKYRKEMITRLYKTLIRDNKLILTKDWVSSEDDVISTEYMHTNNLNVNVHIKC